MSDEQKSALELEREKFEAEAKAENAKRTGVGLRVAVGATRGRQTQNIKYEQFDTSIPDSLPKSLGEFVQVTGISDENQLLGFVIDGFNDYQYRQASDPIAEFINPVWSDEVKLAFRTSVRNFAKAMEMPIDEVAKDFAEKFNKKLQAAAV
jgi:hypothetical protein